MLRKIIGGKTAATGTLKTRMMARIYSEQLRVTGASSPSLPAFEGQLSHEEKNFL